MSTHTSKQDIVDSLTVEFGTLRAERISIVLREGDTTWWQGGRMAGPGVATYAYERPYGLLFSFDPLAGEGDERCSYTNEAGASCLLIDGDHGQTHYFED